MFSIFCHIFFISSIIVSNEMGLQAITRPLPEWPTIPSPQYSRKRSSARYTKGQRQGEACVGKIFKSGSVYEATFLRRVQGTPCAQATSCRLNPRGWLRSWTTSRGPHLQLHGGPAPACKLHARRWPEEAATHRMSFKISCYSLDGSRFEIERASKVGSQVGSRTDSNDMEKSESTGPVF